MDPGPIIAIGGGGFTQRSDPALDAFVLSRLGRSGRHVVYLGAASDDDADRLRAFRERFAPQADAWSVLTKEQDARSARSLLAGADCLYVGGGDTARLLRHLRTTGIDEILRQAWRSGLALAGVSAGAICWFECALARGADGTLGRLDGLGLVPGSCCAHFSSEPDRRPAFMGAVAGGLLPGGVAIDDGVAVLLEPGRAPRAFAARPGARAYAVDGASFTPLPAVNGKRSA